jgi:hypothetical protein
MLERITKAHARTVVRTQKIRISNERDTGTHERTKERTCSPMHALVASVLVHLPSNVRGPKSQARRREKNLPPRGGHCKNKRSKINSEAILAEHRRKKSPETRGVCSSLTGYPLVVRMLLSPNRLGWIIFLVAY